MDGWAPAAVRHVRHSMTASALTLNAADYRRSHAGSWPCRADPDRPVGLDIRVNACWPAHSHGKHNVDCSCAIPLLSTPTGCHACCPWGTAAGTRSHARPAAALGLKIQSCRPRRPGGRVLCAPRSRRAHNRCSRRVQLVRKRSKGQSPHGVMDQTEVACVSTLLSFARAAQRFHRASSIACCRCLLGPDLQFAQLPRGLRCVHSFELPISALSSKPPGCTWRVGDMRRLVSSCLWDLAADLCSGRRRGRPL